MGRPEAIFISLLVSWSLGALITYGYFRRGAWQKKRIESEVTV